MRRLLCVFVIRMQKKVKFSRKAVQLRASPRENVFYRITLFDMPSLFFIFSVKFGNVWTLISWLFMKPADQNLHSFCPHDWPGFSMTF